MKWDWLGISKAGERREPERPDRRGRHMFERALPPLQVHAHGDPGLDEVRRRFVATGYTTWPLGPGTYRLRLLVDDGDKSVAVSPKFKIVKP